MAINKIQISKIFALPTEPSKATLNRFWYDTTNKILKHYDGTSWVPLQVHADDVVVLPNGDTKSLTECLSIIGDGLDSLETTKQNKLLYYSETSGDAPSVTIDVANINLIGSVAEGSATASGNRSHAEGFDTIASGDESHAEGRQTTASGSSSHAEGAGTTASGSSSHAENFYTIASSSYQHAQGKFNIEDSNNKYADIIGNGTSTSARSNAATVSWEGISWSQSDVRAGGTDQDSAAHSLAAKQNATDNSLETTDKTIVGAINEIENKVLDSHLSKLSAGTLYFNNAKLFGSNFTIPNFPFSICATVRVDSWEGSTQGIQTIFQFGNNGTGALLGSICFNNVINNPTIQLRISKNTDGTLSYSEVSYFFDKDTFLGKEHTIIGVCRELESTPVNFDIYVDGAKVATTPYKGLTLDSLSGTVNYAVNTFNQNYTVQPAAAYPMMLRNLYVFNFDVSVEDAPYSIADYVAGRLIPPSLIGNQFTGMYGNGWSVSGDTATCSGISTESYPRITRGVIPSGFNFTFTVDVELAFSGTPQFEAYTTCQKAHAEIYDYSTQLTTQKDSASGGGFYGAASLGITSSGHYRIKFDCESSLAKKGEMQLVIGPLTSGTITLSDTYYTRCNLALENYTIARNATTTLVKDASGNSNDATVQGSGTVAGDNDQSIKVFVDEIKTQTQLTPLRFNVYGMDKKIIPGKYMRLVFSQDSNGNVTPTYVSEEEWNDVYDV